MFNYSNEARINHGKLTTNNFHGSHNNINNINNKRNTKQRQMQNNIKNNNNNNNNNRHNNDNNIININTHHNTTNNSNHNEKDEICNVVTDATGNVEKTHSTAYINYMNNTNNLMQTVPEKTNTLNNANSTTIQDQNSNRNPNIGDEDCSQSVEKGKAMRSSHNSGKEALEMNNMMEKSSQTTNNKDNLEVNDGRDNELIITNTTNAIGKSLTISTTTTALINSVENSMVAVKIPRTFLRSIPCDESASTTMASKDQGQGSGRENDVESKDQQQATQTSEEEKRSSEIIKSNAHNRTNYRNSREKTPMCLVNDLARYNKVNSIKISMHIE